jgi:hypothetical protein
MLKIIIYMGLKDKPARIWIYPVSKQATKPDMPPHNFSMFPPFFLLLLFYAKKFIIIKLLLLLLLLLLSSLYCLEKILLLCF